MTSTIHYSLSLPKSSFHGDIIIKGIKQQAESYEVFVFVIPYEEHLKDISRDNPFYLGSIHYYGFGENLKKDGKISELTSKGIAYKTPDAFDAFFNLDMLKKPLPKNTDRVTLIFALPLNSTAPDKEWLKFDSIIVE